MTPQPKTTQHLYDHYVIPNYGRFDLCLSHGDGCRVWDESGREYLDFGAGIAVCALGHAHPEMTATLTHQGGRLLHASNLYYLREQALLAERLVRLIGEKGKTFFCNSGAEANEALFKLARKFGNDCSKGGRHEVITFAGSFHGRTLGGISATGQEKVKLGFAPLVPGFVTLPFNDLEAVKNALTDQTAAILVEPIQGEGGVRPADAEFLRGLRALCDQHDLLLMFDEIQCGLGRTGAWGGWKSIAPDGAVPDAISWAKGIAGGFPFGAIWVKDRPLSQAGAPVSLANLLGPGTHGTTFGGNPLGCAMANCVLEVIERDGLLDNTRSVGAYATQALQNLHSAAIREVRGHGLMLGICLSAEFCTRVQPQNDSVAASIALVQALNKNGLLTVPAGADVIRWLPPLNVSQAEVDRAVAILQKTLNQF